MQITKNQAFCGTLALLAATSAGSFFAAMATASKVGSIAYGVLAMFWGGATAASIAAWFDRSGSTGSAYFHALQSRLESGISKVYQLVIQR